MSIKASVCIRTFNQDAYIARAVESALNQETDFDFEVVIGDDASTDATATILRRLRQAHPQRIRLVLHDVNVGSTQNLIDTYAYCKGEYIAFLDGDDFWTRADKLQLQADYLDNHSEVTICGTGLRTKNRKSIIYGKPTQTLKEFIKGGAVMVQSTLMLRKRCLATLPDWIVRVAFDDVALQVLCLQHGKLGCIKEVTAFYRRHKGSLFNQLPAVDKIKWDITTWKEIKKHMDPVYHRWINRRLAGAYYRLAERYRENNRLQESRTALARAAEIGSVADRLRYLGRSATPRLYRSLFMLKKKGVFYQQS